jgi:hypothetical protein
MSRKTVDILRCGKFEIKRGLERFADEQGLSRQGLFELAATSRISAQIKRGSEPFLSRTCAQLSSFGQSRPRKSNLSATEANLTLSDAQGTLRFDGGFRPSVSSAH